MSDDLELTSWEELEAYAIVDLPDRLRERVCQAGMPWTGDDPASNHGHTDCWYAHLAANEIERLRTLTEAYGELLDAVFDWLGCDSVQDQEKALVVVATKAHEVHKLTEGA